jgi:hypothetical protein
MSKLFERYRENAIECVKIAQNVPDPSEKLKLLDMAQCWLRLAEQATAISDKVLSYEPSTRARA